MNKLSFFTATALLSFGLSLSASCSVHAAQAVEGPAVDTIDPASVPMPPPNAFLNNNMALGSPSAPIQLIAFIQIDEPDVINEWLKIFPLLKNYADQGLVRLYLNDTYLNRPGYFAELFLQCAPQERRLELSNLLMSTLASWNTYGGGATRYYEELAKTLKLNSTIISSCMAKLDVRHAVHERRRQTFLYNGLRYFPTISVVNSPYRFVKGLNMDKLNTYIQAMANSADPAQSGSGKNPAQQ